MEVLPVPESPVATGTPELWPAVEDRLGTTLPNDYKAYVNRYGAGMIDEFVEVFNPFRYLEEPGMSFEWDAMPMLEAEREIREEYPDAMVFPVFPEPGGLLPWGATANGDRLYWITRGVPDAWQVVLYYDRSDVHCMPGRRMTAFLVELLTDSGNCRLVEPPLQPRFWVPPR